MALLSVAGQRVTSAAGLPVSGGKLKVYNVDTTTLSTLFSDVGMTTPLTNPVVADSNGWLPAIFTAEGSYDVAFLSAGDVILKAWTDWATYTASGAGAIERTLSGSRVNIDGGDIGDGNIGVRYNNGSPDPDAVGGYFRMAGWNGTSADKGIIDAAVVDFLQPKSIKEDGKRLSGVIETEPTSFTGATTIITALPNDPVGTRCWEVDWFDLVFSSAVAGLTMTFSYDGGGSYKGGASDYSYVGDDTSPSIVIAAATSGGTAANSRMRIKFEILTADAVGGGNTLVEGKMIGQIGAGTGSVAIPIQGEGLQNYGRVTHVKLTVGTGTVAGKQKVVAKRGFGE